MLFSSLRLIMASNPAHPHWKILAFMSPVALLDTFPCSVFAPQLNILLWHNLPMRPMWWVNTSIYFNSNQFEALVPSFHKHLKISSIKFFGLLPEPGGDFPGPVSPGASIEWPYEVS
jgi:hypothetical protein